MAENPYYYTGPLDPAKHRSVLIPRSDDLNRVVKSVRKGAYWAILGSRSIGKTTFLRQIANRFKNTHCLYFNFEVPPNTDKAFYQWLMDEFTKNIPAEPIQFDNSKNDGPRRRFLDFLENFKPLENENKKILLLIDEVEGAPSSTDFLKIWRTVHNERFHKKELKKYLIVITGSVGLLNQTTKRGSPFNIAEILYMKDFTAEESERLIDKPLDKLNILIDPNAKLKLISQISGYPQILQQTCFTLVESAKKEKRGISEKDVDKAIDTLFETNSTLDTLRGDLIGNPKLKKLIKDIFKGKKIKHFPYKEFSIAGAGCIIDNGNSYCTIRNTIYETFLNAMLEGLDEESMITEEIDTIIKKYKEGDELEDSSSKKYKIIKKIGKGGIGVVFKAEDLGLERIVALKMLNSRMIEDEEILKKFCDEARNTASLDHPNIVKVFDIGKCGEQHFIIMEYIQGEDLLTKINNQQEFTSVHILYIAKELLKALQSSHTHNKSIIHGDVKPQNIMITLKGEIKIVDFGLSVIRDQYVNEDTGPLIGTPFYISPEQIRRKKLDPRTDIYSTGVTLFHLIAGTVPFKGEDVLRKHLYEPVPIEKLGAVPDEIKKIIQKCMQKDRKERFQDARELIVHIEKVELALLGRHTTKNDIEDITPIGNDLLTVLAPEEIREKKEEE